jgi:hypothetical protein
MLARIPGRVPLVSHFQIVSRTVYSAVMSIDELERRYVRLLRWYPPPDRVRLGDELLDTLLASTRPGQKRPTAHERRALILGGLRARTRSNGHRTARETWAHGLQLALVTALMLQVLSAANSWQQTTAPEYAAVALLLLAAVPLVHRGWFVPALLPVLAAALAPAEVTIWTVVLVATAGIAVLFAALRSAVATLGILAGAAVLHAVTDPFTAARDPRFSTFAVAIGIAVLATALRPAHPQRSAWWFALLLLAPAHHATQSWQLADLLADPAAEYAVDVALTVLWLALPVATLAWAVVDPRAAAAAACFAALIVVSSLAGLGWLAHGADAGFFAETVTWSALPFLLLTTGAAQAAARHARL